jgi:hypothetical protein
VVKELGRGFVRVNAVPWATVSIDGKPIGVTPLAKPIEVSEGTHTVRFEHAWYAPIEKTLTVTPGTADASPELVVDFDKVGVLKAGKTKPAGAPQRDAAGGSGAAAGGSGQPPADPEPAGGSGVAP